MIGRRAGRKKGVMKGWIASAVLDHCVCLVFAAGIIMFGGGGHVIDKPPDKDPPHQSIQADIVRSMEVMHHACHGKELASIEDYQVGRYP